LSTTLDDVDLEPDALAVVGKPLRSPPLGERLHQPQPAATLAVALDGSPSGEVTLPVMDADPDGPSALLD